MNIQIHTRCPEPTQSLVVAIKIANFNDTITLFTDTNVIDIDFNLDSSCNHTVGIEFSTDNPSIIQHPLEITKIILDDFYDSPAFIYRGKPIYDQFFTEHCRQKNIFLDHAVDDCNILNFTGSLTFDFFWPFWRNLLGRP
jgi:hypothetical protein